MVTLLLVAISVRVLTLQFMRAHLDDPAWFQFGSYAKFDRQALINYLNGHNMHNMTVVFTIAGASAAPPWTFEGVATTTIKG